LVVNFIIVQLSFNKVIINTICNTANGIRYRRPVLDHFGQYWLLQKAIIDTLNNGNLQMTLKWPTYGVKMQFCHGLSKGPQRRPMIDFESYVEAHLVISSDLEDALLGHNGLEQF
jgi:hypothetical protein